MTVLYFTATGNSLSVARSIGGKLLSIPQLLYRSDSEGGAPVTVADDEAVGIVSPVYLGDLPEPVVRLLSRLTLQAPYKFMVLTYGEMTGKAAAYAFDHASRAGITLDYLKCVKMVDNNFSIVNVEKQVRGQERKHIPEHIDRIAADIAGRVRSIETSGIFDSIISFVEKKLPPEKPWTKFSVDTELCIGCGTCLRVCPVDNLSLADGHPEWGQKCLKCTACYHNCPEGAIRYAGERGRFRFRNEHVNLSDIIRANNKGY